MNFYLVFCKTRRKFDKYIKVNKIKNKVIIDVRKLIDEENIDISNDRYKKFVNVLIYKKIQLALEKKRDIYYIPNFDNKNFEIEKLIKNKDLVRSNSYNLLLFHDEFERIPTFVNQAFSNIDKFDNCQILKDY